MDASRDRHLFRASRGRNLCALLLIFARKTPAPLTGLRLAAILDVKNPAGLERGGGDPPAPLGVKLEPGSHPAAGETKKLLSHF
jgi:hypothetical protein